MAAVARRSNTARSAASSAGFLLYILRRIGAAIPVLFLIALVSFLMIRAIPGGPFVALGNRAMAPEVIAALEHYYGLDRPLLLNLPGSDPNWKLLHYVDETIEQRVENLVLVADFRATLQTVTGEETDSAFSENAAAERERIAYYVEQGIRREDMPAALAVLTALRDDVSDSDPALAADIDTAIARYVGVDLSALRVSPAIRTSTRSVLYSDLFQSQFGNYLFNLLRFDFGPSLGTTSRGRMVHDIIAEKLPVSIGLGVMAIAVALVTGIPLGMLAAVHHNQRIDHTAMFFAVIGRAVPNIVLGPVLIIIFAVKLNLFPVVNPYVWLDGPQPNPALYLSTAFLPVLTLALGMSAAIARLTRATLLQVLNQDFIRTARSKGLRENAVLYRHALRNSLIPVVTILGPLLAAVLTGTFVVEIVFAIPGLGDTFVTSVTTRDYNLLVGVTILYSMFLVAANILVDVVYAWLDPRIKFDS
ncbi:MAG: ABC transporter permease subunit [Burkholderiales bacterium]|nr:ABC transporter permease subunit [Anaerolineae bacterium]